MAVIISYDLTGPEAANTTREQVRNIMIENHYTTNAQESILPNTTLYKYDRTSSQGSIQDLRDAVEEANRGKEIEEKVILSRCVACIIRHHADFTTWSI